MLLQENVSYFQVERIINLEMCKPLPRKFTHFLVALSRVCILFTLDFVYFVLLLWRNWKIIQRTSGN